MPTVQIDDRAALLLSGPDAESLLQNVITPDLSALGEGEARPGALLSPQGKILFDFLLMRTGEGGFRLDCRAGEARDFHKRMMLYRLRAKVDISLEEQCVVHASWQSDSSGSQTDSSGFADRRFPAALDVRRHYGAALRADAEVRQWHCLRVEHGVAESGDDYAPGDAFPHDILFDQNGGVGLRKGCFVGQEVVSRMHHRGTARRRLLIVRGEAALPASGTPLSAGGRPLGTLGTVCGTAGLAIVRVDRAGEALAAGEPVLAGTVPVMLSVPAYAGFTLQGGGAAETA
ncbi:CAF17-like 4Fe-4S cluster assembly/insertion protein YgfZ [Chelativorans intermedius]|uniref:YgfZ/GcvT domain-containing protein n=1 Tax=Chelativorans intermedius TaxID=515947 RepID=A0ABV6D4M3_9HYPH|nr:folate-binding protein YgfZ [Chelativorans intermedius]MCT8998940.1 folate-binding protein YgfZ [Chelativorans intermedius]